MDTVSKKRTKKTDVIVMAGLTTNVMAQMGKDKPITFKNIEKYVRLYLAHLMILLVLNMNLKKKFKTKTRCIKI